MSKKSPFRWLLLAVAFLSIQQYAVGQKIDSKFSKIKEMGGIQEYTYLPNGMQVLLLQDNAAPVVTVQMVYRVGSKHEVTGNTGSTHLLEHLMFKGTKKFNKESGTSIDSKLTAIGAQMNATTWNDRTNYYETIPSDKIELALDIESDRMRNAFLLKEDKDAEMTVVRNEFERGENNPNAVLGKEIWSTAYMAHPYHHSTIGWRSDIEKMPIEVLRNFYNTYYWPDNATLTIIGDFEKKSLFKLIDKYFGPITKAPHEMPQPYTEEPQQYGPRRVVIKKPGQQGVLSVAYKIPGTLHEDMPALTVLGEILGSGTSSVFNRAFVDTGIAFYGYSSVSNFQDVGLFTTALGFSAEKNHEAVNKQLLQVLDSVKNNGVQQEDVDRIIAKLNAETVLYRDGSGSIASELTETIAAGDWTEFVTASDKLAKVTAADVHRVAKKYLVEDQSTTGYFIPVVPGTNEIAEEAPANFWEPANQKQYYRHSHGEKTAVLPSKGVSEDAYLALPETKGDEKVERKTVAGIDVISKKTGAKDFVTVAASFPIGSYLDPNNNEMIPSLTTQLLKKGTLKNDKFQFSQKLEKLGVDIYVSAGAYNVSISFKCLTKDVDTVIGLLAEELRYPLFDAKEFELIKQQNVGGMKQGLTDPGAMGRIAMLQSIYPKDHPNYSFDIEKRIKDIENASLEDVKAFHKRYFGPKAMHLVAIGDVETKPLYAALTKAFKGWTGGEEQVLPTVKVEASKAKTTVVTIPEKPSAEMFIAQYTGIKRSDKDFLPFYIGNHIFGGGFSGRLMRTVRDEDGLTYSIGAGHTGHTFTGGHWLINASFNPELFQTGLDATMAQLKLWVEDGITQSELEAKKSNLTGAFKVGMATTAGLAGTILSFVERGLEPDYIYQYSKDVEAVTLEEVNAAIKKYIDLDNLIIIKSGSLDENGAPLK
ncbi:insulinase family protein [Arenibacter sp. 6A1]|uniref:M16 family metallopeptidase n=1 Tax=Arenibacter sp. 6A1 TaxID=2720391 RepID=UPI001448789D|nr:pitrilysin family protein [Arenibacter sp. 6A1]NKI26934.1 insulinase family protein [Arenibacter sp. 6A1]